MIGEAAEVTETTVTLGGVSTRALSWGDPTADRSVVAVHSAGLDASSMGAFADVAVAAGYRVVAADLRGHGRSAARPEQISLGSMAVDVVELASVFELTSPRLVGISLGGVVAGIAAAQAPQVWADLAVACFPDQGYPAFAERAVAVSGGISALVEPTLQRWFTPEQYAASHPAIDQARVALGRMNPAGWDATWTMFAEFPGWSHIEIPTTCYAGELDSSTPPEVVGRIAETLGAPLTVLPGAPHQLLMTHAAEFAVLWA